MTAIRTKLQPEDWGRLASYLIGVVWATVFSVYTPSSYQGVISQVIVHVWSGLAGAGCLTAIVGVLTRKDVKIELPGIYVIEVGSLLYLIAQVGFSGQQWLDRLPLFIFILWHMSLLFPRLLGLESYRHRVHVAHKEAN